MTGNRKPRVSVVVTSRGQPRLLRRGLELLLAQTLRPTDYEVIVAGPAGADGGRSVVEQLRRTTGGLPSLRYVAAPPDAGLVAARNAGWREARSEVIAFTDEDTLVDPEWLQRGLHAMDSGSDAVAGHLVVPLPETPNIYQREIARAASAEFPGANCFLRRAVLEQIGGFDERFRRSCQADTDLLFELLARHVNVRRAPDALVVRPMPATRWSALLKLQRKLVFDALLYAKHPHLYRGHVRTEPRWDHYSVVALLLAWIVLAALGWWWLALAAFAGWAALTLVFCNLDLRGTVRTPARVAETLAAAVVIPPVAVFWRIVGWLRYRTVLL